MEQEKIQPQIRITAEGFNTLDHCHELARKIGPNTALYLSLLIKHGKKEKIMIDGCYAVLRLARVYDQRSIEAGCKRALTGGRYTYGTLHSIMVTGTYQLDPSPILQIQISMTRYMITSEVHIFLTQKTMYNEYRSNKE